MSYYIFTFSSLVLGILGFYIGRKSVQRRTHNSLEKLNRLSSELNGAIDQIANVSHDINSASKEQLDSLSSTVSASREIGFMIEKTAETTKHLEDQSVQLKALSDTGRGAVNGMVASSHEIKQGNHDFNNTMKVSIEELQASVKIIQEVAEKTEVINDIVFQTRLLAFNASVEAARAGEAGKGFSVVAEEVGKLAQLSGHAAKEISEIVKKSTGVIESAILKTKGEIEDLTGDVRAKITHGLKQAENCEEIFNSISRKIEENNELIEQISRASKEQSEGVSLLDRSMIALQETAERNLLIASQSSQHSKGIRGNTEEMTSSLLDLGAVLGCCRSLKIRGFDWNSNLVLGIGKMDDEHKVLIDKINIMVEALKSHLESPSINNVAVAFEDFANYTIEHFSHEENYMSQIGYSQLEAHKRIHKNLLAQVGQYGDQLKANQLDPDKFVSFLRNWLISHIMGVDMQYANYSKQGGKRLAA